MMITVRSTTASERLKEQKMSVRARIATMLLAMVVQSSLLSLVDCQQQQHQEHQQVAHIGANQTGDNSVESKEASAEGNIDLQQPTVGPEAIARSVEQLVSDLLPPVPPSASYFYTNGETNGADNEDENSSTSSGDQEDSLEQRDASDLNFNLMNAAHDKIQAVKHLLTSQGSLASSSAFNGQQGSALAGGNSMQCTHKGRLYSHGQSVAILEQPCLSCTCVRAILQCYLRVCPPVVSLEAHKKMQAPLLSDLELGGNVRQEHRCRLHKEPSQCCPSVKCELVHSVDAPEQSNSSSLSTLSQQQAANSDQRPFVANETTLAASANTKTGQSVKLAASSSSTSFGGQTSLSSALGGHAAMNPIGSAGASNNNQPQPSAPNLDANTVSLAQSADDDHHEQRSSSSRNVSSATSNNREELLVSAGPSESRRAQQPSSGQIQAYSASNRSVNAEQTSTVAAPPSPLLGANSNSNNNNNNDDDDDRDDDDDQNRLRSQQQQQPAGMQAEGSHQLPKLTVINGASGQRDSILLITSNPHSQAGQQALANQQQGSTLTRDKLAYPHELNPHQLPSESSASSAPAYGYQHNNHNAAPVQSNAGYSSSSSSAPSGALLEALLETVYSSAGQLNGLNLQGSCMINGSFYVEGSAVLPENNNAYCQYCYCIRQKIMCVRPKCHLSISGCTAKYSNEFACCPTSYNCSSQQQPMQQAFYNKQQQQVLSQQQQHSTLVQDLSSALAAIHNNNNSNDNRSTAAFSARLASPTAAAALVQQQQQPQQQQQQQQSSLSAKISAAIESISRLSEAAALAADGLNRQADRSLNSEFTPTTTPTTTTTGTSTTSPNRDAQLAILALMGSPGLPISGSTGDYGGGGAHLLTNADAFASALNESAQANRAQQHLFVSSVRQQHQEAEYRVNEKLQPQTSPLTRQQANLAAGEKGQGNLSQTLVQAPPFATNTTTERPSSVSDFLEPMNRLGPLVMLPTTPSSCRENGRQYAIGEQIPTLESCKHCYCGLEGFKECKMIECSLKIAHNCRPVTPEGHCCPIRYECPTQHASLSSSPPAPVVVDGFPTAAAFRHHQQAVSAQGREAIQRYRSEDVGGDHVREEQHQEQPQPQPQPQQQQQQPGRVSDVSFSFRDISQCKNGAPGSGLEVDCLHFLNSTPVAPARGASPQAPEANLSLEVPSQPARNQQLANDGRVDLHPERLAIQQQQQHHANRSDDTDNAPVVRSTRIISGNDGFPDSREEYPFSPPPPTTTTTTLPSTTTLATKATESGGGVTTVGDGSNKRNASLSITEELNKFIMQINLHNQLNSSSTQGADYSLAGNSGDSNATQEMMINDQRSRMVDYHSVQAPGSPSVEANEHQQQQRQEHLPIIPSGMIGIPSIEPESIKNLVESNRLALANGEIVPISQGRPVLSAQQRQLVVGNETPTGVAQAAPIFSGTNGSSGQRDSRSTNAHKFVGNYHQHNNQPQQRPNFNYQSGGDSNENPKSNENLEHHVDENANDQNQANAAQTFSANELRNDNNKQANQQQSLRENDQPELMVNVSDDYIDATDDPKNANSNHNNSRPPSMVLSFRTDPQEGSAQRSQQYQDASANNNTRYNQPISSVIFDDELINNNASANTNPSAAKLPNAEQQPPVAVLVVTGDPNASDNSNNANSELTTPPTTFYLKPTTGTPIGLEADRSSETNSWLRSLSGFMHSFGRRLTSSSSSQAGDSGASNATNTYSDEDSRAETVANSTATDSSSSSNAQFRLARESSLALTAPAATSGEPTGRSRAPTSFFNQFLESVIGTSSTGQRAGETSGHQARVDSAGLVMRPLQARSANDTTVILAQANLAGQVGDSSGRARPIIYVSPYDRAAAAAVAAAMSPSSSEIEIVTAATASDPQFFDTHLSSASKESPGGLGFARRADLGPTSEQDATMEAENSSVLSPQFAANHHNRPNKPSLVVRYHGDRRQSQQPDSDIPNPIFSIFRTNKLQQQQQQQRQQQLGHTPQATPPQGQQQKAQQKSLTCFDQIANKTYQPNEIIAKDDPCKTCTCIIGEEMCQTLICPPKPAENCLEEKRAGECCANYLCGTDNVTTQSSILSSSPLSASPVPRQPPVANDDDNRAGGVLQMMGPSARLMAAVNNVMQETTKEKEQQQQQQPVASGLAPMPATLTQRTLQVNPVSETHDRARSIALNDVGIQRQRHQHQYQHQQLPSHPVGTNDLGNVLPPHLRFRPSLHGSSNNNAGRITNQASYFNNFQQDPNKISFSAGQQQSNTNNNQRTTFPRQQQMNGNNNNLLNYNNAQQAADNNNNWRVPSSGIGGLTNSNGANSRFLPFSPSRQLVNPIQRSLVVNPSILLHPQRSPSLLFNPNSVSNGNLINQAQQQAIRRVANDESGNSWKQQPLQTQAGEERVNFAHQQPQQPSIGANVLAPRMSSTNQQQHQSHSMSPMSTIPLQSATHNSPALVSSSTAPKEIPYDLNEVSDKGNRIVFQSQRMVPMYSAPSPGNLDGAQAGFKPISAPTMTNAAATRHQQSQIPILAPMTPLPVPDGSPISADTLTITTSSTTLEPDLSAISIQAGFTSDSPSTATQATASITTTAPPSTTMAPVTAAPEPTTPQQVYTTLGGSTIFTAQADESSSSAAFGDQFNNRPIDVNRMRQLLTTTGSQQDYPAAAKINDSISAVDSTPTDQPSTAARPSSAEIQSTTENTIFGATLQTDGASSLLDSPTFGSREKAPTAAAAVEEPPSTTTATTTTTIAPDLDEISGSKSTTFSPSDSSSPSSSSLSSSSSSTWSPSSDSPNSDPMSMFRVSECNIYGRLYNVGQAIEELSDVCKRCTCTSMGVDCQNNC